MSCGYEQKIALYAGGDLEPEEAAVLERHLAVCRVCAELVRALEVDRELIRSAPPQVAEVNFAEMRSEVVRRTRRPKLMPALLAAAAVLVAVAAGLTWRDSQRKVTAPPPVVATRMPPVVVSRPTAPLTHVRGSDRRVHQSRERQAVTAFPVPDKAIRVPTKDPSVVIIWFAETKGDSNE